MKSLRGEALMESNDMNSNFYKKSVQAANDSSNQRRIPSDLWPYGRTENIHMANTGNVPNNFASYILPIQNMPNSTYQSQKMPEDFTFHSLRDCYVTPLAQPAPAVRKTRKKSAEYRQSKRERCISFSKRKGGLFKKARELHAITGSQVLLIIANESGRVFTYATDLLSPLLIKNEYDVYKCLNK